MEWKFKGNYRIGLLAGVAAVALLSGTPVFAAPLDQANTVMGPDGVNNYTAQTTAAGAYGNVEYAYVDSTNTSSATPQVVQTQTVGSSYNTALAYQGNVTKYALGDDYISQLQYSNHNTAEAAQYGQNNKIYQVQRGGVGGGFNKAYVGTVLVGEGSYVGGQYGFGNVATQTQQGTHETASADQFGIDNTSTQYQNVYGAGGGSQDVFQSGSRQSATQHQYSASTQDIAQWSGADNKAKQYQASTSAGGSETIKQGGYRNFAEQKQYFGAQSSTIHQNGGTGEGSDKNLAYTFQYGPGGNLAYIRQGGNGNVGLGGGFDYNGKAYINQFAGAGASNTGLITQYGNVGGHNRATIDQGTKQKNVNNDYARIDQANYSQGTFEDATTLTGLDYALVKQMGSNDYSIVRQMNSGNSTNLAYVHQYGNGSSYAGIYQGSFRRGESGSTLTRLGNGRRPFFGDTTGSAYHPEYASWFQFATNDKAYINQWNSYKATGGTYNANANLAGTYQNVGNSLATIKQGTKSIGVYADTAKVYQCNGVGFACTTAGTGTERGDRSPFPSAYELKKNNGSYGNDIAHVYQTANNNNALVVQMGFAGNATLNQSGSAGSATILQYGISDVALLTQSGSGDTGSISQGGNSNTASLAQNGLSDTASITQYGTSDGATVTQNGASDSATVSQGGTGNSATLAQNASSVTASITQTGISDIVNVTQTGAGNLTVSQTGTNDSVTGNMTLGTSANISQAGLGQSAVVH